MTQDRHIDPTADPLEFNIHFGGGGAPAIAIGVGAQLFFQQAGLCPGVRRPGKPWLSIISGNSAGAMVALPWCAGHDAAELAPLAIEKNFLELLHLRGHWWDVLRAELMRKVYEKTLPAEGVFGTRRLGEYFERLVPTIPKGYYAVAAWPKEKVNVPVVVTHDGCYVGKPTATGQWSYELLDKCPLSVGLTLRSTGSLPGILESIKTEIGGQQMELVDGGLVSGANNISPMLEIFGKPRRSIIVVDSSGNSQAHSFLSETLEEVQDFLYALFCDECYMPKNSQESTSGCLIVKPDWKFGSINFGVGPWQKLRTLLSGYRAAFQTWEQQGHVDERMRLRATTVLEGAANCVKYSWGQPQDVRIKRMIGFLQDQRMYARTKAVA